MPSAPLAISSQSRKRSKNFHVAATSADDDKENVASHASCPADLALAHEAEPCLSQRNKSPQTPANKIPLADLIGNAEDLFNSAAYDVTPEDHVFWQHGPRSSNPSSSMRSTQRGKKRARSSSPASSSQIEKSNHFSAQKEALDLQTLQQSLKTPQNDPASDLWARYATASLAGTNGKGVVLPPFAHLMTSSPQTPSTTNSKDSGLRRSISCGIEWPLTENKRRKKSTKDSCSRVNDIFASYNEELPAQDHVEGPSRVKFLVGKLSKSIMRKQSGKNAGPSSSSPLPNRAEVAMGPPASPLPGRSTTQIEQDLIAEDRELDQVCGGSAAVHTGLDTITEDSNSSEFGDADLDLEFLENVELAATPNVSGTVESAHGKAGGPLMVPKPYADSGGDDERPLEGQISTASHRHVVEHASSHPASALDVAIDRDSDDEFGTGDGDFATEMQGLVEQYDTQDTSVLDTGLQHSISHLDSAIDSNMQRMPVNIDFDDVFDKDDDLWNELGTESFSKQPIANIGSMNNKLVNNRAIKRYLIVDVVESDYENAQGRRRSEKILSVKDEKTKMLKIICLRQSWYESRCTKGSYVHLIGDFDRNGQCVVEDTANMIILHPDHLISATVVADSFTCTRRAVLQDRVKATGQAEKPQVYGHMIHEIFGEALKANEWTLESLKKIIERLVSTYIESLYEINVQVPEAVDYLMSKMPELIAWASLFVSLTPKSGAVLHDRNGAQASMSINKLLEVEEHVWSPMYGLKGNVDATVQVAMQLPGQSTNVTLTVPLELKTGKKDNNESHRAQTQLYTLLMSDRYDIEVTTGVLYYLETAKVFRVEGIRNEIRHMIIQRNELACYVRNKLELPPMIKKQHMCKNCYAQTSCFVYHKLVESGDGETSGMKEIFDEATHHLRPSHQDFFKRWDDLLTKEERDAMKFRRELWTMLSVEREALGRCFSNVVIEPGSAQENLDGPKINRFQYTFVKNKAGSSFSFTESQLTIGEPIVISDEKGHFALANGYITNVRPSRITVAVDRRLHNARTRERHFDAHTNQVFTGIMDLSLSDRPSLLGSSESNNDAPIMYRVDKDEFSNGMATARNNLIRLMEKDLFRARELRQLIIEGMPPSFKPTSSAYTLSGPASQSNLNVDQRRAIEKVMSAKDYALVLGMPGTGKTTTIAHIIRALVSQGKSVLLASYTHTAVDNILLKIKDDNIPILRLGAVGKIHSEVQSFVDLGGIPKKTIAELENSYVNSKVVATTCLGINQPIFNARIFDYCIVDEASQITLPVCLGPIRMARTFILVGDHYQLPPLVQNREAQEGGLDISLFKLLSDAQPGSVVNLEHQYRMSDDIMTLSNELIYSGRLKCGTQAVADRLVQIPNLEGGLAAHHHNASSLSSAATPTSICTSTSTCWLRRALSPQARCLFLNTDTLAIPARDTVSGGSRITNPAEAVLTTQLVTTLIRAGMSPRAIGVITFYRSQLALLRQELKAVAGSAAGAEVEMHTADKFQGRDKEVIVLSCVRSNDAHSIGELLKDWRRVNVAVTRARSKLVIVGSKNTLGKSQNDVLEGLVKLMDGRGWLCDLPKNALGEHAFESGSQATGRLRGGEPAATTSPKKVGVHSQSPPQKGVFRKPEKTFRGGVDVESLLGKHRVLRDIMNDAMPTKE